MDEEENEKTEEEAEVPAAAPRKKRIMILLLPLLIVIGISIGIYFALSKGKSAASAYNVVQYDKENKDNLSVFYDLPEIQAPIATKEAPITLKLKLNLELSSVEDLRIIEILTPKLNDVVLSHIVELSEDEIKGSEGMYWLKEELLYRLNLAAEPVKIKKLSFGTFELQ